MAATFPATIAELYDPAAMPADLRAARTCYNPFEREGRLMRFLFILWDLDDDPDGNVQHCADNNLTKEDVAEVLQNPTETDDSHSSGSSVAFGDTSTGRHLIVVYEAIDADTAYPITAYDVPRRRRP